jgi:protein TonB
MLNSNVNIYGKEWLEVIFDSKNKSYGAYQLRQQNGANTARALLIASVAFILLFMMPKIMNLVNTSSIEDIPKADVSATIRDIEPIDPEVLPLPSIEPPAAKEDQTKFAPPIVREDDLVQDDEPPSIEELKNSNPGQRTIAGVPDGDLVIVTPPGDGPKQSAVVEDNTAYDAITIEVQPSFRGGIDKFYDYLRSTVRYPAVAMEQGIQGKVFVSFIVERDGTLTDIQVLRKLGGGTDEEAIRVLKASPAWNPGIQNGKKVRVKFNIPISFFLTQ